MPTEQPTLVRTYTFSEKELVQAKILTTLNRQLMQTLLTQVMENKINLEFNYELPDPARAYSNEVRYLQGQSDILVMLINQSDETQHELVTSRNQN